MKFFVFAYLGKSLDCVYFVRREGECGVSVYILGVDDTGRYVFVRVSRLISADHLVVARNARVIHNGRGGGGFHGEVVACAVGEVVAVVRLIFFDAVYHIETERNAARICFGSGCDVIFVLGEFR